MPQILIFMPKRLRRPLPACSLTEQFSDFVCCVLGTNQRFSDQHGVHAGLGQPCHRIAIVNSAFADDQLVGRNSFCQPEGHIEIGRERIQISIVDSDHPRSGNPLQDPIQLPLVMGFEQAVHPKLGCQRMEIHQLPSLQRGHDQQDRIGTVGARFVELHVTDHKLFVKDRDRKCALDLFKIPKVSLEKFLVGQDETADAPCSW